MIKLVIYANCRPRFCYCPLGMAEALVVKRIG